jgi:hypothetical protein
VATKKQKKLLTLPTETAEVLVSLREDKNTRNRYIVELRNAGWTLESISEATGITREGVRLVCVRNGGEVVPTGLPVPEVPTVEIAERVRREYVEPDPADLSRMLELQPLAQKVRGKSGAYRAEAEEYTALLNKAHSEDGVPLYRLAKRLGITHGAIRFRLARYGYKPAVNGKSKVYDSIQSENRAIL